MTDASATPLRILMIEDNPGDVRLVREALREAGIDHRLQVVSDGEDARSLLAAVGTSSALPDVVLLDLDLPKVGGRELLVMIRSVVALRDVPVVVLTSSAAEEDVHRSFELAADHFVTKPMELDQYVALAVRLADVSRGRARSPDA
jgi:two-component system response regulator